MKAKKCQDHISDLTVGVGNNKRILLATSGEGNLSAFHTIKKKMLLSHIIVYCTFLIFFDIKRFKA